MGEFCEQTQRAKDWLTEWKLKRERTMKRQKFAWYIIPFRLLIILALIYPGLIISTIGIFLLNGKLEAKRFWNNGL